jgi:hypothetical protein
MPKGSPIGASGVGTPEFNGELGGQAKLCESHCERRPTTLFAKIASLNEELGLIQPQPRLLFVRLRAQSVGVSPPPAVP